MWSMLIEEDENRERRKATQQIAVMEVSEKRYDEIIELMSIYGNRGRREFAKVNYDVRTFISLSICCYLERKREKKFCIE